MTNPAEYISGRTVQEQMDQLISYVDTRAAEVATAAIASDVADVAQAKTDAESARDAAIAAKDTAVSTVSDCVKKTPASAQTITGQDLVVSGADVEAVDLRASGGLTVGGAATFSGTTSVPDTAAETKDLQAVNGNRLQDDLDAYAPMVRTSGNQTIGGIKDFETVKTNVTQFNYVACRSSSFDSDNPWIKVGTCSSLPNNNIRTKIMVYDDYSRSGSGNDSQQYSIFRMRYSKTSGGTPNIQGNIILKGDGIDEVNSPRLALVIESDNTFSMYWKQVAQYNDFCVFTSIFSLADDWVWTGGTNPSTHYADIPSDAQNVIYLA